ncbi:GTPase IMAP family member 4-like [Aulostomus maculatus]
MSAQEKPGPKLRCRLTVPVAASLPVEFLEQEMASSASEETVKIQMKKCVVLCTPGPKVLLLLVQPTDFTERDGTKHCQKEAGEVDGRRVVLVDTPGLFDTSLSNATIQEQLEKRVSLLAPGPHAFLLVLQIGRFTKEERDSVELIKTFFGKEAENFLIIVFTRGDESPHKTLESYIKEDRDGYIRQLTEECGGRYHAFNNKDPNNRTQVTTLLAKVESMRRSNGGGSDASLMFQEAEETIEKETRRLLKENEEEIQRQLRDCERKHEEEFQMKIKAIQEKHAASVQKLQQTLSRSTRKRD